MEVLVRWMSPSLDWTRFGFTGHTRKTCKASPASRFTAINSTGWASFDSERHVGTWLGDRRSCEPPTFAERGEDLIPQSFLMDLILLFWTVVCSKG